MKYQYEFIGWCQEGVSDKVWIVIDLSDGYVNWAHDRPYATVWGRRGKKLQHKIVHTSGYEMDKLVDNKRKKGYQSIHMTKLDQVYPEFEQDLEKTAFWAALQA